MVDLVGLFMKRVWMCLLAVLSFYSFAESRADASVFVNHERNSSDQITTVGVSHIFTRSTTGFVGEVNTAIGYAEVLTESDFIEEYPVWESGIKLGYYSTVFAYIEAGIDLAELALNSERENCCIRDERYNNQIDGYAGIGAGIHLANARVTVFIRARQIDSNSWESKEQVFTGVNFELTF